MTNLAAAPLESQCIEQHTRHTQPTDDERRRGGGDERRRQRAAAASATSGDGNKARGRLARRSRPTGWRADGRWATRCTTAGERRARASAAGGVGVGSGERCVDDDDAGVPTDGRVFARRRFWASCLGGWLIESRLVR